MSKAKIFVVLISLIICSKLAAQDTVRSGYGPVIGDITRTKTIINIDTTVRLNKINLGREFAFPSNMVIITSKKVIDIQENGDTVILSRLESFQSNIDNVVKNKSAKKFLPVIIIVSKEGVTQSITKMKDESTDIAKGELIFKNENNDRSSFNDKEYQIGESWSEDTISPLGGCMHSVCKLIQSDLPYGDDKIRIYEEISTGDVDKNLLFPRNTTDGNVISDDISEVAGTFKMQGTEKISMKTRKSISSCGLLNMRIELTSKKAREAGLPSLNFVMDGSYEILSFHTSAPKKPMPKKK